MALVLLLGAALLLWFFGDKLPRNRTKWQGYAAILIGILMLTKSPILGLALIGSGMFWLRERKRPAQANRPFVDDMALAEARDLLGLSANADRDAIIAAHRRLITRNHPDSGGTEALAARLNAARDLLLKQTGA